MTSATYSNKIAWIGKTSGKFRKVIRNNQKVYVVPCGCLELLEDVDVYEIERSKSVKDLHGLVELSEVDVIPDTGNTVTYFH